MPGILVHVCCAPCFIGVDEALRSEGLNVTGYWFNPNIQPYSEFLKRLHSAERYSYLTGTPIEIDRGYDVVDFTSNITMLEKKELRRCRYCYSLRLYNTALYAKNNGYNSFSTTLLCSHQQDHEMIRDIARAISSSLDIPFEYRDFRKAKKGTYKKSKEMELYRQNYCGCILSEWERYNE